LKKERRETKKGWKEGVLGAVKECSLGDGDWEEGLSWRLDIEICCLAS
jgi:hypothetical protein